MDTKSILQFCKERNVEIYIRYDNFLDCLVIRVRRKQNIIERGISRFDVPNLAFGPTILIILRSMADELDRAEKEKCEAKEVQRLCRRGLRRRKLPGGTQGGI